MKAAADHQPGAGQPDTTELLRVLDAGLSPGLLERALTHRSYAYENGNLPTNERLEFLGDSVLGLVVTDALFRGYPELPEGQLAKLRAAVVNMRALAGVARGLRLGDYLRLGRGEDGTGGRDKSSILADTLEAVIGAVYIERGLDEASALVHRRRPGLEDLAAGTHRVRGARRARVPRRGERPGPPEVVPCPGPGGRPRVRQGGGAVQEGGRAAGRRGCMERHQQR